MGSVLPRGCPSAFPDSLGIFVSPYFHKSNGMRFQPGPQPPAGEDGLAVCLGLAVYLV